MMESLNPIALVSLDLRGRVLVWSDGAAQLFGWSAGEVLRVPFPGLANIQSIVDRQLHTPADAEIEVVSARRDGRTLQTIWHGTAVRDSLGVASGVLEVIEDQSVRRALAEAARSEGRFRQLLDAAPDAILEVDSDGRIVLMNQAAERSFGYAREELLTQPIEVLVPSAMRGRHAGHRHGYQHAPEVRPMGTGLELEAQRKDGSRFPVEISLSPVQYDGEKRITAIVRDVSDRRRTEDRLREIQDRHAREWSAANSQLEARNLEIERANRLKSEFLASMSHELRTPLHTIIGFSELLGEGLDGELNATQRRFVEHIHRDSLHLLELINDILDLSKIEAGRLELRVAVFALEGALQEVLATIRPQAAAKSQRLRVSAAEGIHLDADRVRFKEILYNLLSNAVKFTDEGGAIGIAVLPMGDFAQISVQDTGVGIAADHQDVVFDAFQQVGSTTKGVREGTGLGLAITRRLVEQHGGRLSLESKVGEGSCFSFGIPLDPAQRTPRDRPLVLLIHSDRPVLDASSLALSDAGYLVAVASLTRDGGEIAMRLRPDFIAIDPSLDGFPEQLDKEIQVLDLSADSAELLEKLRALQP